MLKDNLILLRNIRGYSQEKIAEKINISRQAYAKWESGATVPDIEKCAALADVYGVTVDSLIKTEKADGIGIVPPAPRGNHIWGTATLGDRGQIVVPKEARDCLGLKKGSRLVVLSNEEGIALIAAERFEENLQKIMLLASKETDG